MNIGRNAPCPCGSGRKFKKCCEGSIPVTPPITDSPVTINTRIAYEGRVGRERKQWCEDFLAWKAKELTKISAKQKHTESAIGKPISCAKGCSFCCSQHVGASLQECEGIVYWLHNHLDLRDVFMTQYAVWRNSIREHEHVFQETSQALSASMANPLDVKAREIFMQKAEAYLQLNIMCPFLADNNCSIYPVRPFVCAQQVVVSPPEHCKPSSTVSPMVLFGSFTPEASPPYFRGLQTTIIFSAAALLVHEIIHGGYFYLNDLPNLAGLEEEVFSDPEVRSKLKL